MLRSILLLLVLSTVCLAQLPEGVRVEGAVATYVKAPAYPVGARAKQLQGSVDLELNIASDGSVADARVLNGAMELRRAALLAVLQWQFLEEAAVAKVSVDFRLPRVQSSQAKIGKIDVSPDLPESLRATIERRLQPFLGLPSGTELTEEARQLLQALRADLQVSAYEFQMAGQRAISLFVRGLPAEEDRIQVEGLEQKKRLLSQGKLVYPPLARQARIQGVVRFEIVIGKDGLVQGVRIQSGHPLLVPAALDAVKGNRYEVVLRDGQPVEVLTTVDVEFRFVDQP